MKRMRPSQIDHFSHRTGKGYPALWLLLLLVTGVASLSMVVDTAAHPDLRRPLTAPARPVDAGPVNLPSQPASWRLSRLTDPDRTVVSDGRGTVLATFTDGARTVVLTGPNRTFAEPGSTSAAVHTTSWVRLAPVPWRPGGEAEAWFQPWLSAALANAGSDVLSVAAEYLAGAPPASNPQGVRFAGDARHPAQPAQAAAQPPQVSPAPGLASGPAPADQAKAPDRDADFTDYLGVPWTFPDRVDPPPAPGTAGAVDSAGFVRLVYGYRLGYPLLGRNAPGPGLPRRAFAMADVGPGVVITPNQGTPPSVHNRLQPGDLVFFDLNPRRGMDHVGIYVGLDDAGRHRFVSSRVGADGPTVGNVGGASVIDGKGYYARTYRVARRL